MVETRGKRRTKKIEEALKTASSIPYCYPRAYVRRVTQSSGFRDAKRELEDPVIVRTMSFLIIGEQSGALDQVSRMCISLF
jgi:hypothetical protein